MSSNRLSEKTRKSVDSAYDAVAADCFGLWSNCLWRRYDGVDDFVQLKEAFLYLVGRLIDDGIIRFINPELDVYFVAHRDPPTRQAKQIETHCIASSEDILAYLRKHWPNSARHFDDEELNLYFYEIAPMVWKDKNGNWIAS
ncbi:hypothetical protein [Devosia beringensis]|uniref:hypothetical protein n=1 Tax=Devosia beringensis TaxID=2657486 RepID=UPI00186B5DFF|nr:hypothetical protein [Devosia beringensis]